MVLLFDVLMWLPRKARIACILRMPSRWIEDNFEVLPISFIDIFYQRTWSLEFLERVLLPEDSEMWDHISTWYTLPESFCERNIDWLNFHDLVYNQTMSHRFYLHHQEKFDWIAVIDRERMFQQFYENLKNNTNDEF